MAVDGCSGYFSDSLNIRMVHGQRSGARIEFQFFVAKLVIKKNAIILSVVNDIFDFYTFFLFLNLKYKP